MQSKTTQRSSCIRYAIIGLAALCVSLFAPGPAAAFQLTQHSPTSFFDGTGTIAGAFGATIRSMAVDQESGDVYVLTNQPGLILAKFNASGAPTPFTNPSLGGATSLEMGAPIEPGPVSIAVDNSHTATQGRIYVYSGPGLKLWAFNRDGSPVGGAYPVPGNNPTDIAVDPTTGDLWVVTTSTVIEYAPDGVTPTGISFKPPGLFDSVRSTIDVDSLGNVYVRVGSNIDKYNPAGVFQFEIPVSDFSNPDLTDFAIDPVTEDLWEYNPTHVSQFNSSGSLVADYPPPAGPGSAVAFNDTNNSVYVGSRTTPSGGPAGDRVDILTPGATVEVPDVTTGSASDFLPTNVALHGTVNPDSVDTTDCKFEWSVDYSFGNSAPCTEGTVFTGSANQQVSAIASNLTQGKTYHYRLVAANANGSVVGRQDRTFVPSALPTVGEEFASGVHGDGFTAHVEINPGGADTGYHVEYGTADCSVVTCAPTADRDAGSGLASISQSLQVAGLAPDTTYHYRVVATNQSGTEYGADHTITTFPYTPVLNDSCPNAHVRQQTGAALLPDCRAYELVSAANTAGYNVESDLVAGQDPFAGYPNAESKVLYGIHSGAIPGPWNPTNRGVDPYVATRGEEGWSTSYVGLPADNPNASGPFASALAEADQSLDTFAFGGSEICSPCFEDGSTGMPLRLPSGDLVQGMAGTVPQPSGTEAGVVKKHFSADGNHFIFGSTAQFEADANSNGTDATIYDRNLKSGVTQVVSKLTDGSTIANGSGVAEIDISNSGLRILIGQLISTDSAGNHYYHLYLHMGDSTNTIDLSPSAISGVLFDGMSSDGSRVFFTTTDPLLPQDTDVSADIYEADLSSSGTADLRLISTEGNGGPSNDDSCNPPGDPRNWNAASGEGNCSALAFAGGAGVASGDGTFYFLSPEKLDITGPPQHQPIQDEPNLYVVQPNAHPRFVATIDSSLVKPTPLVRALTNPNLAGAIASPEAITVDQSNGDIYVNSAGSEKVFRFDSAGAPHNFTTGPGAGTNGLPVSLSPGGSETQVAVDNSSGPLTGDVYVASYGSPIKIFAPNGSPLGSLTTPGGEACGVAVDQSTGTVYVGEYAGELLSYMPNSPSGTLNNSDYTVRGIKATGIEPCNVAADGAGHVYASSWPEGPLMRYATSSFQISPSPQAGTLVSAASTTVTTDPVTHYAYVDEGNKISVLDPEGALVETIGSGDISESRGVAVSTAAGASHGFVYAANPNHVVEFGFAPAPSEPIDNPAIVHGAVEAGTHTYSDFQVTPNGHFASFSSLLPLTGYDNDGHYEVFRYDAHGETLDCASCNPTNARAEGGSSLAPNGLGLTDDGHLYFNSNDVLASRDLDNRQDVYLWDGGDPQLISTGSSPFDSSLLGASADNINTYFFTKDTLVPQDKNGTLVKVYDARVGGGFPYVPPQPSCKASDECHGASSQAPGPPGINTITGTGGNRRPSKSRCRHSFVKRHGRCMSRRHHKKHHKLNNKRANTDRGANTNRGGDK